MPPDARPPNSRFVLSTAVFLASLCTLVIELVAGRIMAPYVGVSLYTWTSIIGVVLAGISIGAYLGGRLADRFPDRSVLGWIYLASGLAALAIAPLVDHLGPTTASDWLGTHASLMTSVLLLTAAGFFVPALLLGMVSPVVVKLAIRGLDDTGSVVGRLYALSTIGSLFGTFATGFFLISWLGTRRILLIVGLVLIASAPVFGGWLRGVRRRGGGSRARISAWLLALGSLSLAVRADRASAERGRRGASSAPMGRIHFIAESNYYTIRLARFTRADLGGEVEALYLDHLAHSFNDIRDPSFLLYDYLKVFERAVRHRSKTGDSIRLLFLGGGGYTLPRLIEQRYPRASIDVVEIDPMVTRVARDFMGVPARTRIRTINEDARWFMIRQASYSRPYDLIFTDAFSDLSIPYHLTTREFAAQLRGRLAPGGIVLANVIDSWHDGAFMPSYLLTLEAVFGKGHVGLVGPRSAFENAGRGQSTFIILASNGPLDVDSLLRAGSRQEGDGLDMGAVSADGLARYLRGREAIILTDDHAPVDNLIAPLFAERFAGARR